MPCIVVVAISKRPQRYGDLQETVNLLVKISFQVNDGSPIFLEGCDSFLVRGGSSGITVID